MRKFDEDKLLSQLDNLEATNEFGADKTKVMIIEDDPDMVFYITKILGNRPNVILYTYSDEVEAVCALKEITIDICIIDVTLQNSNGFELGKVIRGICAEELPIIYISQNNNNIFNFYQKNQSNTFFCPKPLVPHEFKKIFAFMNKKAA